MAQSRYPYHDNSDVDSPRQCQSPSNIMSNNNHQTTPPTPSSRIPNTLQAVFLASNRGRDVHKPPPERVAYKEFIRNWWGSVGQGSRNGSREGSRNGSRWGSRRNSVAPSARTSAAPSAKATPVGSPLQGRSSNSSSHNKKMTPKVSLLDDLGLPAAPLEAPVKMHKKKKARLPTLSPQQYLDAQCRSRGYSTERFCTLKTAYHNSPTPMQLASYDSYMISLVKQDQVGTLQRIYDTQLLSPNPCNQYGESLVHTICRLGHSAMLQILLDAGADLQVADDYGRTPLHDACWGAEPNFACVRLILDRNPEAHVRLFYMTDARGAEPLTYVRREHWAAWIEFLESVKNDYWPKPSVKNTTVAAAAATAQQQQPPPPLTLQEANTRLVIDPPNPKATKELTRLIASGKMTPEEGLLLIEEDDDDDDSSYSCGEEEDDDDSDDSDMDNDDDDGSEKEDDSADFDAAEMKAFLQSVLPADFTRAN